MLSGWLNQCDAILTAKKREQDSQEAIFCGWQFDRMSTLKLLNLHVILMPRKLKTTIIKNNTFFYEQLEFRILISNSQVYSSKIIIIKFVLLKGLQSLK
jgi:hypothetical protein